MAIIGHFDYSRKWTSPDDFPTYEASEEQVRADMQALFDEISTYLNGTLIDWVEEQISGAITGQIPDRSLTNLKLVLATITGDEIASKTIQLGNMDDNSVDSDQYVNGSIDPEHLADDAVTLRAMAANSVDSDQYVDGSIDPEHLADDAVTLRAMAANSVDSDQYVDGSIDPEHLADDAVTTRAIADGAVTNAKLGSGAAVANIGYTPQKLHSTVTVTLAAAGWSNNQQTGVAATGVTASNTVFVAPDPTDYADYTDAAIRCTGQGAGTLDFACDAAPTSDITVNVVILGV